MSAVPQTQAPWGDILKESLFAGVIALIVTSPIVGLRTVDKPTGLELDPQFGHVVAAAILVFFGRLGLSLIREGLPWPALIMGVAGLFVGYGVVLPTVMLGNLLMITGGVLVVASVVKVIRGTESTANGLAAIGQAVSDRISFKTFIRWVSIAAIVVAVVMPALPFADRQLIDIGTLLLTYIMLGWGLNIVVGLAGLLDLGYVAFFAVGAYSYALLATIFGLSFWICLPFAGIMAAMAGLLLGFPVLRLRGDYFAIVTLGFGEIIRVILLNWTWFTGGPNGISGIPRPSFFGIADFSRSPAEGMRAFHELFGLQFDSIQRIIFLYYLILALALVVNVFTMRIRKLPLGRAWEALRENDIACTALGINATNIKLAAFGIGAMFAGFAGSFFATRQGFISPESFTFMESAMILAIVVLGGMGSQVGVVIATFLVIGLPEAFRDLQSYRMLAFGMGMVGIMLWRPKGLLSHREPTVLLGTGDRMRGAGKEAVS